MQPENFALRMSLSNKHLMKGMLVHAEHTLPTSLTVMCSELASLAVWMFSHCIRGIERSIYTKIEVHLRKIVRLGRTCVQMRDEILLQIIKQLRQGQRQASVNDKTLQQQQLEQRLGTDEPTPFAGKVIKFRYMSYI